MKSKFWCFHSRKCISLWWSTMCRGVLNPNVDWTTCWCYITLHYIALHYITLHYITLYWIELLYFEYSFIELLNFVIRIQLTTIQLAMVWLAFDLQFYLLYSTCSVLLALFYSLYSTCKAKQRKVLWWLEFSQ